MTATPHTCDFPELLDVLGFTDTETVALLLDGKPVLLAPAEAGAHPLPPTAECFFAVNAVRSGITSGRGTAADVIRLCALPADLDVKPGAFTTLDQAKAAAAELGLLLGTRAAVLVETGTGLQAYWPIADGAITDQGAAEALLRRWHIAVAQVGARFDAKVDNIYDLPRMLRIPGSNHNKTGTPLPVTATRYPLGETLTVRGVIGALDRAGITEPPPKAKAPKAEQPFEWSEPTATCAYMRTMIAGIPSDTPTAGRHQWMLSQRIRVLAAARHGCLTHPDYQGATTALFTRYAAVCASDEWGTPREPDDFEQAYGAALDTVKNKSDEEVAAELGGHTHTPPLADFTLAEPAAPTGTHLDVPGEADFWAARPYLAYLFMSSLQAMTSPWAVLNEIIANVLMQVPADIRLPAAVGAAGGSLNFIGVTVAHSGIGKGLAGQVRDALVPLPRAYGGYFPPGSGEGMSAAFFEYVKQGKKTVRQLKPLQAARFQCDEVDTLTKVASREGSTLDGQIRTAFTGGQLGFQNANPDNVRIVDAFTYRLCLTIFAQSRRLGPLFAQADGGTPQRIFWTPAQDPRVDATVEYDLPDPSPFDALTDTVGKLAGGTVQHVKIPRRVWQAIRKGLESAHRGQRSELDSHAMFVREKISYALALMDGRYGINEEDWDLSGIAMAVSDHTRTAALQDLEQGHVEVARTRGRRRGVERAAAAEAERDENSRKYATQWRWGRKRFTPGVPVDHSKLTSDAHNARLMRGILEVWTAKGYIEVLPGNRTTYLLKSGIPEEP